MNTISKLMKTTLALVAVGCVLAATAPAQAQVTYRLDPESKLWVEGTSTRSDWTVYAPFEGDIEAEQDAAAPDLQRVRIVVPAAEIESRKSTIMDRLMHDALQVEAHPEIVYTLTGAEAAEPAASGAFTLQTTGELTLAGVTKSIEMDVQAEPLGDGRIRFTGSHPMRMSEYGMTPPSAMFGALRTGDDVVVHFDVVAAPGTTP